MDEFLFKEQDWLYKQFSHIEFIRSVKYLTFKMALNLLLQNGGKLIVETGTQRMVDDPSGCSTTFFGAFCERYGKRLITVDNSEEHMSRSKGATKKYVDYITYVVMDSVEFLRGCKEQIDLLYLDSMDCPFPPEEATEAQMHQLREVASIVPRMCVGSVILLDDNNFENGGKTRLAKKYLLESGEWRCILDDGQSLWEKVR